MLGFLGQGKDKKTKDTTSVSLDITDSKDLDSHCLISGNLQIHGDVYFSGSLRVDGKIEGKVSTYEGRKGQLIVSKGAVINGPISATNVLADGTINGTMEVVEKLECRANSIIKGHVIYGSIDITSGAQIEARCRKREDSVLPVAPDTTSKKGSQKKPAAMDFLATKTEK